MIILIRLFSFSLVNACSRVKLLDLALSTPESIAIVIKLLDLVVGHLNPTFELFIF